MTNRPMVFGLFFGTIALLLTGCNSGGDTDELGGEVRGRASGASASGAVSGGGTDRGAEVFFEYCAACHGEDGNGIGSIYPPLAGADFLQDRERTVAAVVNGLQGPITINEQEFNGVMAPLPAAYDDETAAAVINYVVDRFGAGAWQVTAEEVSEIRD